VAVDLSRLIIVPALSNQTGYMALCDFPSIKETELIADYLQ